MRDFCAGNRRGAGYAGKAAAGKGSADAPVDVPGGGRGPLTWEYLSDNIKLFENRKSSRLPYKHSFFRCEKAIYKKGA